ncbi:MAG: hypothetical protein OQK04_04410 [Kangiellaceae bacterium]|nr:hypothetical protein [Kangiellaceae bacterium]MCW8997938.1 hypothetical protein [Kangiellaceae bacterium]
MKHLAKFSLFVFLVFTNSIFACSFGGSDLFKPSLERWEEHPGPAQKGKDGDYWEKVPAPVVNVSSIKRGSAKPGSSCDDAGIILLEISLPKESTYSIEEFAIYFRVKEGQLPDAIFPDVPLTGEYKDGKMTLLLAWLDGHPSSQIALDLKVEAFFVTNSLNIGESTVFNIVASKG